RIIRGPHALRQLYAVHTANGKRARSPDRFGEARKAGNAQSERTPGCQIWLLPASDRVDTENEACPLIHSVATCNRSRFRRFLPAFRRKRTEAQNSSVRHTPPATGWRRGNKTRPPVAHLHREHRFADSIPGSSELPAPEENQPDAHRA